MLGRKRFGTKPFTFSYPQEACTVESIYIKRFVRPSVCPSRFVCPRGTNISYTQERGGQTFLTHRRGGQTFFVGGGGGFDDVEEEIDVSEANICVSGAECLYN